MAPETADRAGQQLRDANRSGQADRRAGRGQPEAATDELPDDVEPAGADGEPDADLLRALSNGVGHQPVDAERGQARWSCAPNITNALAAIS